MVGAEGLVPDDGEGGVVGEVEVVFDVELVDLEAEFEGETAEES